jgi:hypothetical protein
MSCQGERLSPLCLRALAGESPSPMPIFRRGVRAYSSLLRPGTLRVPFWRRVSRGPGILVGR